MVVLERVVALLRLELLEIVLTNSCLAFYKNFLFFDHGLESYSVLLCFCAHRVVPIYLQQVVLFYWTWTATN